MTIVIMIITTLFVSLSRVLISITKIRAGGQGPLRPPGRQLLRVKSTAQVSTKMASVTSCRRLGDDQGAALGRFGGVLYHVIR
jgi:hypothetical protein